MREERQGRTDAAGHGRERASAGRPVNRRVVLKAAAGFSALAAGAALSAPAAPVRAEENGGTRASHWAPPAQQNATLRSMAVAGDWVTFQADYPFSALGVSWPGDVGLWPVIEVQLSTDGGTWSDSFSLQSQVDQGVRKNRDGRVFTPLLFADNATYARYRTVDSAGNPGEVAGIEFTYIDSTDGPWEKDIGNRPTTLTAAVNALTTTEGTTDDSVPPQIVTRAQWGADESWRYDSYGEVWPPEYQTVEHVIIHHTETPNTQDPVVAVRAIYYYHAIDQGWGDIGYNYLVDRNGNIYQGRVGGQNVIGGHSYQFAFGSSGISIIGDYQYVHESDAAKAGLVSIVAWVGRFLDPHGTQDFHEIPDLPNICAHRDVNDTTCPGDMLYADIPEIRDLVAATLQSGVQETPNPGGIIIGDRVRVQTDDGTDLNLRDAADGAVIGTIPNDQTADVIGGPTVTATGNWYQLRWSGGTGWATAQYLIVDPLVIVPGNGDYPYGLNVRISQEVNLRSGPSTSASVIQTVPGNTWAFVLAGPEEADSWTWYQVRIYQIGDGWVIRDALTPIAVDQDPAGAKFKVGDWVYPRSTINVRTRPGLAQTVIGSAPAGLVFQLTQAPVGINGHIWYGAYADKFGGGWVAEDDLVLTSAPGTPSGKFAIGDSVRTTDVLNLRSSASTGGSVVAVMPTGTTGKVLAGPTAASGYVWWKIETSYGSGWAVEDWLAKTSTSPPPPPPPTSGKFRVGDQVRTTDVLNLRSGASTGSGVVAVLSTGTTGTVTGGPRTGSGYTWWQIRTSAGTGWAAEDWLAKVSTSPPPPPPPPTSGKFKTGDSVRATDYLNLRTSPGGGVIAVLDPGTTGTVTGGPRTSGGYTWWQIRTSAGTGWAAEDWLAKVGTSPPPPPPPPPSSGKFATGDSVRTTDYLNLRTSPGGSVVTVLDPGANGTVTGGPTSSGGYTWWQIRTSAGTGWAAEDWLVKASTSPPPPPSGGITVGSTVRVFDGALNMRSGPGTGYTVVAVLPDGTRMTVAGGPQSANGYTWYQVSSSAYGTGWSVGEFLQKV